MAGRRPVLIRATIVACAVGLLALVGASYFVIQPAMQVQGALRLLAATQVGRTTADEFSKMAVEHGARLRRDSDGFGTLQRNKILEYLHLAPQTAVLMNVTVTGEVVTGISVNAWIGEMGQFAKINIHEFDSHNTGCGDVPVCVKPTSSTMTASVFFVPGTPASEREQLLSLNSRCLDKIGGCKDSREFFPFAWEHPSQ
jgi:hypothetical protein